MKKIIHVFSISITILSCNISAVRAVANPVPAQRTSQATKLEGQEMDFLNSCLVGYPKGIALTDIACKTAAKIYQELPKSPEDPAYITKSVSQILEPVKEFFDIIQKFEHIIKPLVLRSLNKQSTPDKKFFLVDFFSSKANAAAYFEQTIKTKIDLKQACWEFITFFRDLKASLSPEALKAYENLKDKAHHHTN